MSGAPLAEAARFLSFLLFLALGLRVAAARDAARKRAVVAFVAYVIAVNAFAGVTQIDNWPFTTYTLAASRLRGNQTVRSWTLRGVDRDGREVELDPQSWSPVFESVLQFWLNSRWAGLDEMGRREAGRFLVGKANEARARLAAGRRIGFERVLGPVACGYWWRLPRVRAVRGGELRSLRFYRLESTLDEVARQDRTVRETLVLELGG